MKRRATTSTFAAFESAVDGTPGTLAPTNDACAECAGVDHEHERWCPRGRERSAGADYLAASRARGER